MENKLFNPMEIDAIGEIMNISLGSSATAVSNMLDHRVDITTPKVSVINAEDFSLGNLEPAIGVEIRYVSGLEGSNIMLLKRSDVKVIVDILMGSETPDEEFDFNEFTVSAVCEVMNQMMGAASTALSDFLGTLVNISTPQSFELDNFETFKKEHFPSTGDVVVVRFMLSIEDALQSEFINVMSIELAQKLIAGFHLDGEEEQSSASESAQAPQSESGGSGMLSQEEIERLMSGAAAQASAAPAPQAPVQQAPPPQAPAAQIPTPMPEMPPQGGEMPMGEVPGNPAALGQPPYPGYPGVPGAYPQPPYGGYPPYGYYPPPYSGYPPTTPKEPAEPKVINTQAVSMPQMDLLERLGQEQAQNLDLIMSVPLEVTVEIGRTRRKVQEILTYSKGSLVVLDKLAGDQVDLFVNGRCIARGDVVVIDDSFGIRITEILKNQELGDLTQKRGS